MHFLDIKSLSFVALFTSLMLPLVMQAMGALTRQNQATRAWNRGVLFYSLGFVLLATRNVAPDFLSIVVANLVLLVGYGELLCGLKHFFNRPVSRRAIGLVTFLFAIPLTWYTYGNPSLGQRVFFSSIVLLWMSATIALELFRAAFATQSEAKASYVSERNILLAVCGVFTLSGVIMVFRMVFFVDAGAESGFGVVQKQLYSVSFLSAILNNFVFAAFLPLLVSGRIQRELYASEALLLKAQEQSGLGTALIDTSQEEIVTNTVLPKLLGMEPGQTLTREMWREVVHPDDRKARDAQIKQAKHSDDTSYQLEYRIVRFDTGEVRWVQCENEVNTHESAEKRVVMCTLRDITELKQAELAALASKDLADQANRTKGMFLANMSHEIRTPMNAILGMLKLLHGTQLDGRQQDYVAKTEGAAQSLLGLLNDILDLSKVEAGKLELESEAFSLDALLRNLGVVLSAYVGSKDVEVLFDVDSALPPILMGDAMRLQQVLVNLCGNAIKFTSVGQVVLSVRLQQLASQESGSVATIEFAVQDTGIGISPEHQRHIFDGFTQAEGSTTRRYGGTGLGLAISKHFVELMAGEIKLSSTPGVGSRFYFSIAMPVANAAVLEAKPRMQEAALASAKDGARNTGAEGTPMRVLVIDDNPIAGQLMQSMAGALGWSVEWVDSGARALELLAVALSQTPRKFPYDAIYTDWRMPDMDGWETTRRIHRLAQMHGLSRPVIIMVSAGGREALVQRSETEQDMLSGFLVKPVTASMLQDAFAEAPHSKAGLRSVTQGRSSRRQLAGMRILVVEDNLINQQVADELLSAEGAIVSLAANGRLGVDAVAAAAPQFDVVLMDIQMPVLDGYAATQIIREELGLNGLPIIAMTANAMTSDRDACLAAGMNEHIGKPFDIGKLVSLLIRLTGLTPAEPSHNASLASGLSEEVVPHIAGLDLRAALVRMSGNRSLYVRTAKDFIGALGTLVHELRQAEGDVERTKRLLHTVKGNAATLGAMALSRHAATLEAKVKDGEILAMQLQDGGHLQEMIQEAQIQLNLAMDQLQTAAVNPVPRTLPQSGMTDAVKNALRELQALAAASDMAVLQRFAELRETLVALPEDFNEQLANALQALDLKAAQAQCKAMLEML